MKRFFAFIIITIILFSCNANNQPKTTNIPDVQIDSNYHINSMFIIPLNHKSLICKIENNEILEVGSFPKTTDSKSIIVNDEFICSIDSLITVFDIKGNLLKVINSDFEATSLNSKNKVVYFGGKSIDNQTNEGEIFAIHNLENKDFKLEKINIPIDVSYGKAIDDILIVKNKLLLVDDIVYPKYLLEYDITDSKKPIHIKTKELDNNGTYEHIVKGDLNDNWLVLLSSTVGRGGSSDHIVIEGKTNGHISVHRKMRFIRDDETETQKSESFNDICLIDNMLYVLVNSTVYSLDLNNEISKENLKEVDSKLKSINKILRAPDMKLILISHDNKYEKVALTPIGDCSTILMISIFSVAFILIYLWNLIPDHSCFFLTSDS